MRILDDLNLFQSSPHPLFLGLGNFDGIHLGHRALLNEVVADARKNSGIASVLTFKEHPQQVLHPNWRPQLLMSGGYKQLKFDELGIDLCFWLSFTLEFSKLSAENFIRDILIEKLKVKKIYMGYNAFFGHNREGNAQTMEGFSRRLGFSFKKIEPVKIGGEFVSSSRVRKLITEGNFEEAEACLGGPFRIFGKVVSGAGRGKALGFPTANLKLDSGILPPFGVYPVRARVVTKTLNQETVGEQTLQSQFGQWNEGIMNFGLRPTFEQKGASTGAVPEVHLFSWQKDIEGANLETMVYPRLRPEKKFAGEEALKAQIHKDIRMAEAYFSGEPRAK